MRFPWVLEGRVGFRRRGGAGFADAKRHAAAAGSRPRSSGGAAGQRVRSAARRCGGRCRWFGCVMVLSAGVRSSPSAMPSKPTTLRSRGTCSPQRWAARIARMASRSLEQSSAVGRDAASQRAAISSSTAVSTKGTSISGRRLQPGRRHALEEAALALLRAVAMRPACRSTIAMRRWPSSTRRATASATRALPSTEMHGWRGAGCRPAHRAAPRAAQPIECGRGRRIGDDQDHAVDIAGRRSSVHRALLVVEPVARWSSERSRSRPPRRPAAMPCRHSAKTGFSSVGSTTPSTRLLLGAQRAGAGIGQVVELAGDALDDARACPGVTLSGRLKTRETVATETPAFSATDWMLMDGGAVM